MLPFTVPALVLLSARVAMAQWVETPVYEGATAAGVVNASSGFAEDGVMYFAYDLQTGCPGSDCVRTLYATRWDGALAAPVAQVADRRPDEGHTHVHGYMPVLVSASDEPTFSAFVHRRHRLCGSATEVVSEVRIDKSTLRPTGTPLLLDAAAPCVDTGVLSADRSAETGRWTSCWTAVTNGPFGDELVCTSRAADGRYALSAQRVTPGGFPGVQDRSRVLMAPSGDVFLSFRFEDPSGDQWAGLLVEGDAGAEVLALDTHGDGEGDRPWLSLGPDGSLHAVWEERAPGERHTSIRHAVCATGDAGCGRPEAWAHDATSVDDSAGPDLRAAHRPEVVAAASGAVVVSWVDEGADEAVMTAWACPGSRWTVESPTALASGVGHRGGHPMLFLDEAGGTVNLVYQSMSVDDQRVIWASRPLPRCD